MSFRFLWITDPWETLDHVNDTTLRLIQESIELGFHNDWANVRSMRWDGSKVCVDAVHMILRGDRLSHGKIYLKINPHEFDQIHYRVDPPVNHAYIHPLQLLLLSRPTGRRDRNISSKIVNPAKILLISNEKMEAAFLDHLMPPSVISSEKEILLSFIKRHKKAVMKPLHEAQSKGVERLETDSHSMSLLKKMTHQFSQPIILQKYLNGIVKGEQRLWFIDGRLLAHAKKIPKTGDFRINMDQGGTLAIAPLSVKEKSASEKIGLWLKARKIRLAAVDLIDGFVTDFNFTSPGLLVQMEKLLKRNLAREIILKLVLRMILIIL